MPPLLPLRLLPPFFLLLLPRLLLWSAPAAARSSIPPYNFTLLLTTSRPHSSSPIAAAAAASNANDESLVLVPTPSPALSYHGGALLTGRGVTVHVLWYGAFAAAQQAAVADFLASFAEGPPRGAPSVSSWWRTVRRYTDGAGAGAAAAVELGAAASDPACRLMGKSLKEADLGSLVGKAIAGRYLPGPPPRAGTASGSSSSSSVVYVVFTAEDVLVEDFCMNSCGTHDSVTIPNSRSSSAAAAVPWVWVGNPGKQCPGLCAWPYAVPQYGPAGAAALKAPNGDPATDGMIVNLALLLAGTATNPFDSGYFQGDAAAPLEAGSACQGIFGSGSYPGYPGQLLQDKESGASYNALGANGRRFLLPALWDPPTRTCQIPPVAR